MKEVWVKADPWKKELVTTALEAGADAVIVPADKIARVKELGLIKIVSEEGDIKWGEDVVEMEVRTPEDEDRIVELGREKRVVVKTTDWRVIPLENLVARTGNIFVEVENLEDARTASGILENGVHGLVITHPDPVKVRKIINVIKEGRQTLDLAEFVIDAVIPAGIGDRVCVDTCTLMGEGEGLLVGNSSQGLLLVHSESIKSPYVAPRPFRVNAGAIHSYTLVPGGRTRYLSELEAGDEVMGVDSKGCVMNLTIGRVKIERRPLLLVRATGPKKTASAILQNAETIRLVNVEGKPVSVVKLRPGDKVMGYVEEAARHFGHRISETIVER